MTDASVHPDELDPEYHHHGGFPEYGPASPGAGFGQFVATMRRLQDLAVAADPGDAVWDEAAERAAALVELLSPFEADEGKAPAGRTPGLPGMGSLLLPPWTVTRYGTDGVETLQSQTCVRRLLNNRHCQDTQARNGTFGSTHHAVVVSGSG